MTTTTPDAPEHDLADRADRPAGPAADAAGLGDQARRLLAFERARESAQGSRDAAIRAEFGVSPARYYQMLYAVLDSPPALRHDPLLVRRLQRLRDHRRAARGTARPGPTTASHRHQD